MTETEVAGNQTLYNFGILADLKLTPGIWYYTNVVAYSFAGILKTETSDGFIIDNGEPVTGTVYHGTSELSSLYARLALTLVCLVVLME